MSPEFTAADLSSHFLSNRTSNLDSLSYLTLVGKNFSEWTLKVEGLVATPRAFSLANFRALFKRIQTFIHDCIEGEYCRKMERRIAAEELCAKQPIQTARHVVFHCADPMLSDGASPNYESIDLDDAYILQTNLAYNLND